MNSPAITIGSIPDLLRGQAAHLRNWIQHWQRSQFARAILVIFIGSAFYGAAVGVWRDPMQAFYVAIKFPLILLLTAFANAFLNGVLAPLMGLQIGFRQSLLAILMSFMIAAVILGAFSPLIFFLVWNAPPIADEEHARHVHAFILLLDVLVIAFAGIAANARLIQLLRELSGSKAIANRIFLAWIAGNLFLGSQLSWILRPFIGSPTLPVEFLRTDAFRGNFYEAVFHAAQNIFR